MGASSSEPENVGLVNAAGENVAQAAIWLTPTMMKAVPTAITCACQWSRKTTTEATAAPTRDTRKSRIA